MQVQVADVTAELARRRHTHLGVHVGTVYVDATTVLVHHFAQGFDFLFKHAVGAGVGNHHARQTVAVLLALGAQVVHVDVTLCIGGGHYHFQTSHLGAGGVGAVGTGRNQADVALALTVGSMVGLDRQQARVFALATCVRLQAHVGIASNGRQPAAQQLVQFGVTCQLVGRGKWVQIGKLRPGDGNHLAGSVELHGARAQRDHAAVQRQVFVGQRAQVAQHARFRVVAVEHRVGQEAAAALQFGRNQRGGVFQCFYARQGLAFGGENRPQQGDVVAGGGFV